MSNGGEQLKLERTHFAMSGCKTCLYWKPSTENPLGGICRRLPPMPLAAVGYPIGVSFWPITQADSWCGEYSGGGEPPSDKQQESLKEEELR